MQIINGIDQGTQEWLDLRKGVATASNFSKVLTPATAKESASLDKYAKQLALELTYKALTAKEFKSDAMILGNELEAEARQAYCEEKLEEVEQITFIKSDCGNFGCSPDGLVGDDGLIEIKCLEAEAHSNLLMQEKPEMPADYKCQVQGQLWISERKWCDFVAYNNQIKDESKRLIIIRVFRDEEFIKKLEQAVLKAVLIRNEFLKKLN